ncbi:hypothetical protein F2Q68_00043605 [Brassica cretica]|uniref:non-specific serine/threonine protein kinase n=1 Tax=Brassica cretica TaxID=69181 RepID=A0A8S9LH45_BRACR|nr:hypothetical protein F2Q68_00043605 [Brassica cretica]
MNSFNSFLLLLITSAYCIFESVQAQDQSEFISLDCGLVPKDTIYREKSTNIVYKSDANYIESGVARQVNAAYMTLSQRQRKIWSLRSFPEGTRNCYNFNLTAKRRYLIRADFVYGNYDDRNQLPSFDLHVGPNKWTSVSVPGLKNSSYHEMIHVLTQDPLQVCLVKTGETTPFISSLQLRPLHNETYGTKSGSLVTISRVYFSPTTLVVRYADDIHDRGWSSYLDSQMKSISTDLFVNTSNFYDVPQAVARNAAVPANESQPLTINWSLNEITTQIYVYMHFAEIQNLEAKGTREFNIYCNGNEHWLSYFRPPKFTIKTIANSRAISSPDGKFNLTLAMTGNSTLPPLINGLELYKVLSLLQLDTDQDEVSAMVNIKRSYGLEKKVSWQGDPCAPQIYLWEGLNCSYPDSKPPRIISLDLSMNDLSGDIPDFFADMKSLKLIKLSGNPNLNGKIPDSLKKSLSERKKVPVVAIVFGVSALLVILAIFFVFLRWKRIKRKTRSFSSSITRKDLRITFPKILEMTNNFERVLGKGGFGTVYHGKLDDTQVAVKMLSSSSAQGYKEFKAEVELLLRVHHRHLVGLVGYCDDGDNLALIYEYMAKGDLHENMSGKHSGNVLSWETRMQIAVEAAQEDPNDQVWSPFLNTYTKTISTDNHVDTSLSFYEVPQAVIRTAGVPANASEPWSIWWTLDETTQLSYVYMHFAEVQTLKANDIREFNITYNGGIRWYAWLRPESLKISSFASRRAMSSPDGKFNFTFTMTGNSTLPPLLNALEIYTVVDLLQLETVKDEVSAMLNIKKTYGLNKKVSWQGDPCVPQLYRWEGLNCSYPDSEPSRIISLNLNGSELNGTITSDISKLTQLIELDLSKNDLSGEIPAFFADMKLLKLILDGTTIPTVKGKSSKSPVVAIAASVAGVFALIVILAIFFVVRKKKTERNTAPGPPSASPGVAKSETRSSNPSIISKDRRITYSEVLKMTNNFGRVLGKGGFGTVYHGNLDDAQVAVKMLSHSSAQGYKEFKAEVELLLRVHHRHLVGLVGYCDDGDNLALIYEYMANGDLRENMSGKRGGNVLTWENRMQIAVESAQGLEYLHNGCRPPMVHRDVKTTNILLTERYGAKLADFGLSRSFPIDGECHVSTVVAGTPGYLDPEYYRTNWLSEKSDVYSFGVVLLEIVTNQPVIDKTRERPHINEWVGFMLTKGDIRSIIDPKLMGDYDTNGAWKIVELAMACVNPSSNQRPKMAHVVMELNECVALEIARRQGSQEMYSNNSVDFSLSEFAPGAR